MSGKTYTAAVVLIPPLELWPPIQAIRREHDRHNVRWVMPHITLLYPFRPQHEFVALAERFSEPCADIEPFNIHLAEFSFFHHGRGSYTLWLAPEPTQSIIQLQTALEKIVPDCNDARAYSNGFTPHLSVGQVRGQAAMRELIATLQSDWRPVSFSVNQVSLIWRGNPPDDVFRVDRAISFGKVKGLHPSADTGQRVALTDPDHLGIERLDHRLWRDAVLFVVMLLRRASAVKDIFFAL